MDYLRLDVNPPEELDRKIIVKKSEFVFDDAAMIVELESGIGSLEWWADYLLGHGFDLWSYV